MRTWKCQRVFRGAKCGYTNPPRARKCVDCGKPRPAKRRPAHMAVLSVPYETWEERFGPGCGICGFLPQDEQRRLDRDHDHRGTGRWPEDARGLLCHACNRALKAWVTPEWLRAAAAYLERVA